MRPDCLPDVLGHVVPQNPNHKQCVRTVSPLPWPLVLLRMHNPENEKGLNREMTDAGGDCYTAVRPHRILCAMLQHCPSQCVHCHTVASGIEIQHPEWCFSVTPFRPTDTQQLAVPFSPILSKQPINSTVHVPDTVPAMPPVVVSDDWPCSCWTWTRPASTRRSVVGCSV